jgi:ATP-binding cassette subfamily A (ABC1) protein 1
MKLKCLYRLFPGFCLGDGLIQLTLCNDNKCPVLTKDGYSPVDTQGVFAWDVVGGDLVFLALEIVVYMFITFAIEYTLTFPGVLSCFSRLTVKDPGVSLTDTEIDDEDVARERERVAGGGASGEVVVLNGLRKVYPASTGPKVAVQNLSFGIPTGECFGFLGINGAGKTTTLSILSGEFPPTAGDAWIAGFDIQGDQSLIRRKIGYCPQFDALLELLTVEEHLDLYVPDLASSTKLQGGFGGSPPDNPSAAARTSSFSPFSRARSRRYSQIKGVAVAKQAQVVQKIMKEMDLLDFANKAAGSLSGGNKRKLSVAIAMIGGPSIVFLDEPSTGMDPVARRFMWDVISNMSTKEGRCSVILTTHSMEEAEALCSRIGIMVNGRLRCLGSGQHLKVRYGGGFEVDVKIQKVPAEAILDAFTLLARKSALPVAAYTNVPDLIIERLGNKGADKIYSSEQEAVSVLSTLAGVRMGVETLGSVCAVLGKARRADEISELGSGSVLYDMNRISGSIQLEAFLEWYLLEDVFEKLSRFLGTSFAEVKMLERSTMSSCRYQVAGIAAGGKGGDLKLPAVFKVFEDNKAELGISEYSVGQTTLEQVFNQFAGGANNPENAARAAQ